MQKQQDMRRLQQLGIDKRYEFVARISKDLLRALTPQACGNPAQERVLHQSVVSCTARLVAAMTVLGPPRKDAKQFIVYDDSWRMPQRASAALSHDVEASESAFGALLDYLHCEDEEDNRRLAVCRQSVERLFHTFLNMCSLYDNAAFAAAEAPGVAAALENSEFYGPATRGQLRRVRGAAWQ
mgnify:CR=1 FL=1|tara:strand:- start:125 stop:673 length:549 start_codon:yes stop_codon:yes gene_type:complete